MVQLQYSDSIPKAFHPTRLMRPTDWASVWFAERASHALGSHQRNQRNRLVIAQNIIKPVHAILDSMDAELLWFYIRMKGLFRERIDSKNAQKASITKEIQQLNHLEYFNTKMRTLTLNINALMSSSRFKRSELESVKIELLDKFWEFSDTLSRLPKCEWEKKKISDLVGRLLTLIEKATSIVTNATELTMPETA